MLIGITGPNASGKGEVANYLKSKGFIFCSLSDILREESTRLGLEPSRENLIKLGNDLRRIHGPSILATKAIEKISGNNDYVIDSIRNPYEIESLRKIKGFFLIGIDAPVKLRFERLLKRKRPGDPLTLEEFIGNELKENLNNTENQQLNICLSRADIKIINDSTLEEFFNKIDEAINKLH